jgi:hypothetical protein
VAGAEIYDIKSIKGSRIELINSLKCFFKSDEEKIVIDFKYDSIKTNNRLMKIKDKQY